MITTTADMLLLLIHATIIPTVLGMNVSTAAAYSSNSVLQYRNGVLCAFPDPQSSTPVLAGCYGVIALIIDAHVYGAHSAGVMSYYHAVTSDYLGSAPLYQVSKNLDVVVCVTGARSTNEYETMCWDTQRCFGAHYTCSCGFRHAEGKRVAADGCE